MAIDNAEKRKNVAGLMIPHLPGVTPNAGQDAQWRYQAGWSYGGLAALADAGTRRQRQIKSLIRSRRRRRC